MLAMKKLAIVDDHLAFKAVFGGFAVLDEIDVVDHPEVLEFAKTVANYVKMKEIEQKL